MTHWELLHLKLAAARAPHDLIAVASLTARAGSLDTVELTIAAYAEFSVAK